MKEKITIVIDQDGSATVGVSCVKGKKCVDLTKAIESALGKTEERKPTAEMYEVENAEARH